KGAAILETPRKKDWDKQEQIKEVQMLRYYAMDILSSDRELKKELSDRIKKLNEWDPRKGIQYSDLPMEVINNYQENPIDPMDYLMNSMKNLSLERKERYQDQKEDEARKNIHNNKIVQITQKINEVRNKYSPRIKLFKKKNKSPTSLSFLYMWEKMNDNLEKIK